VLQVWDRGEVIFRVHFSYGRPRKTLFLIWARRY
jgi:hypothetical protein